LSPDANPQGFQTHTQGSNKSNSHNIAVTESDDKPLQLYLTGNLLQHIIGID